MNVCMSDMYPIYSQVAETLCCLPYLPCLYFLCCPCPCCLVGFRKGGEGDWIFDEDEVLGGAEGVEPILGEAGGELDPALPNPGFVQLQVWFVSPFPSLLLFDVYGAMQ